MEEIARELRGALSPIVAEIAGAGARPALLVHRLDIDRNLAGRITRALRSDDDLECLHLLPAPTGLRIFLDAAAEAGLDDELIRTAEESVDHFHALIDETPGGRATLDAGISAHSQEARERNEKSAKQAVYKAMSYLLGVQCESVTSGFVMQPSEDGENVDCIDLSVKIGIRRLRPTAPVGLAGYRVEPVGDEEVDVPFTTLDHEIAKSAEDFLLPEFSSKTLPSLETFEAGGETIFALAEDGPPANAPLTLTMGVILRGAFRRWRTPGQEDDYRTYSIPFPCRTLVRDVFLHEQLFDGVAPQVTQYMPRMIRPQTVLYKGVRGMLDSVDLAAPLQLLGTGLGNAAVKEIPSHARLLEHAFERAGWDPDRFRGYRVRITYPVPFIYMSWWFDPPERPSKRR